MKVAVLGASGYTGLELLRILLRHPEFEIAAVSASDGRAGRAIGDHRVGREQLGPLEGVEQQVAEGRHDEAFHDALAGVFHIPAEVGKHVGGYQALAAQSV